MYWKKEKLHYEVLIPPIIKPFELLNGAEAKEYFNWYIEHIPERVNYLQTYSKVELDYSMNSLIEIWKWFLKNASIEKTPQKRMKSLMEELKNSPREIAKGIIEENKRQFSLETEYIIRDIAMYFGEVCVKNHNSIYWGYHTDIKKDSFANKPILMGFEDRDADKKDLLIMYQKWERMIHD